MFVSPSNSHVEALTLNVIVLEDEVRLGDENEACGGSGVLRHWRTLCFAVGGHRNRCLSASDKESSPRNRIPDTLILNFPASRTVRK